MVGVITLRIRLVCYRIMSWTAAEGPFFTVCLKSESRTLVFASQGGRWAGRGRRGSKTMVKGAPRGQGGQRQKHAESQQNISPRHGKVANVQIRHGGRQTNENADGALDPTHIVSHGNSPLMAPIRPLFHRLFNGWEKRFSWWN